MTLLDRRAKTPHVKRRKTPKPTAAMLKERGERIDKMLAPEPDRNPYTQDDREVVWARNRGKPLGNGLYRQFCHSCGLAVEVAAFWRYVKNYLCADCAVRNEPDYQPSHNHGTHERTVEE